MTENTTLSLSETGELKNLGDAPEITPRPLGYLPEIPTQKPWRLRLQISSETHHETVGMEIKDIIIIGRTDAHHQTKPDLDVAPFGGEVCGVSRHHAHIIRIDDTLFIEDLGSTNGTRLNGHQLKPNFRYRLRDGDELRLGKMKIVVRFIKAPLNKSKP